MQSPSFTKPTRRFSRTRHSGNRAFSLLELSIVVLIIGIMVASILPAITQQKAQENQDLLEERMNQIEAALLAFRIKHGRLPCPGQEGLNPSNSFFARESLNPGACTGGAPAATNVVTNVVVGSIPTRALGLDDAIGFDPWGRAFSYMVDTRMTANAAYSLYPIDNTTVGALTMQIRDEISDSLSTLTDKAIAVLWSAGPNGHGGYLPSGTRYTAGSTNADEQENCNCIATADLGTANASFVTTLKSAGDASGTSGFDDTLRYYTRGNFVTQNDID